jgi:hypothetical protein
MLDIDVKNRQNLARHSQIFLPIAIVRQAASDWRSKYALPTKRRFIANVSGGASGGE